MTPTRTLPANLPADGHAPCRPVLRVAGGVALLLAEVAALTPWVEFSEGAMQSVADARLGAAALFALVAFLFLAAVGPADRPVFWARRRPRAALAWLAAHLGLYALFFACTVALAGDFGRRAPGWVSVPVWLLLGGAVGLTAFLPLAPAGPLAAWAWRHRGRALLAAGLGACLFAATPAVQGLWPRVAGPALAINRPLLARTYGHAVTGATREGAPVVGTQRLLVLVTPQCSELDALAAFWLLGAAALVGRWRQARTARFALVLLAGGPLLYLLNAVRIYGLVVLGTSWSPRACVGLAHSRVAGALFLGVTAALLSFALRRRGPWAAPRPAASGGG
jgi:exosortase/archaeosortase family protein